MQIMRELIITKFRFVSQSNVLSIRVVIKIKLGYDYSGLFLNQDVSNNSPRRLY